MRVSLVSHLLWGMLAINDHLSRKSVVNHKDKSLVTCVSPPLYGAPTLANPGQYRCAVNVAASAHCAKYYAAEGLWYPFELFVAKVSMCLVLGYRGRLL